MLTAVVKAWGVRYNILPVVRKGSRNSIAWHTIKATDDLTVELWPTGDAANEPLLKICSKATGDAVTVYLDEARHPIDALAEAAADLAAAEAGRLLQDPDDNGSLPL